MLVIDMHMPLLVIRISEDLAFSLTKQHEKPSTGPEAPNRAPRSKRVARTGTREPGMREPCTPALVSTLRRRCETERIKRHGTKTQNKHVFLSSETGCSVSEIKMLHTKPHNSHGFCFQQCFFLPWCQVLTQQVTDAAFR